MYVEKKSACIYVFVYLILIGSSHTKESNSPVVQFVLG